MYRDGDIERDGFRRGDWIIEADHILLVGFELLRYVRGLANQAKFRTAFFKRPNLG
jgi:hypothetical protein